MKSLRSSVGTVRGAQPRVRSASLRPSVQRRSRSRSQVQVQAIFSFLSPKAPAGGNAKAAELADELIELVSSKRASAADVNKLVSQLAPLGTKNPVRSKLLFGAYKLVYSSKPGAALGTRQILEEPDLVREVSEVKVLGLLPGTQTQSGELNGVSGDTYEEVYDKVEVKGPVGGESKAVDVARLVQVLYLDQELRVVRVKQEGEAGEGAVLVYQRLTGDSEDDEDEAAAPAPKQQAGGIFAAFAPPSPKEGTATIAEREVMRKLAAAKDAKGAPAAPRLPANLPTSPATVKTAARGGTVKVAPPAPRSPSPPPRAPPAPRVDAKAAAEAQRREAEAKAKAKEAALAKEKAEADKRAAAERQGAIKALLEQLSEQLREAQADSRDAAKEAKDLERANGAVLKQVAGARLQLRSAAEEVEKVEAQLSQAAAARSAAEQALKQALAGVSEAQAKVKAARK